MCVFKSQSKRLHVKHHMGWIIKGLTYDYGRAETFFHLLGKRALSEHDKLHIKESPPHCEDFFFSLKLLYIKEIVPLKTYGNRYTVSGKVFFSMYFFQTIKRHKKKFHSVPSD